MQRRTTIAIAAGSTLVVATLAAAIGLNVGLMSGTDTKSGPGTFEPIAVESESSTTAPSDPSATDPAADPSLIDPSTGTSVPETTAAPSDDPGFPPTFGDDARESDDREETEREHGESERREREHEEREQATREHSEQHGGDSDDDRSGHDDDD